MTANGHPSLSDQLAGSVLASLEEGIVAIDARGGLLMVNAAAQRILGVTEAELRADPAWWRRFDVRWADGEQAPEGETPGARALATGRPVRGVTMYATRADGASLSLLANYQPLLRDGAGPAHGLVVSFSDQTERRQAEERLERSFLDAPIGMAVVGLDGRFVQVNPALCEMLARPEQELVGMSWQEPANAEAVAVGEDWRERALADPEVSALRLDKRCARGDGGEVDVAVAVSLIRDGAGRSQFFICQYLDIGERKRYEAELAHRALHDTLTGLANRALLEEQLAQALARTRRGAGSVAVLFVDLDGFKRINDSLGHRAGDSILRDVARRLRAAVRPSDVVARFGGDEFVVLCEVVRREEAMVVAERVERSVGGYPLTAAGEEVFLTASVGVCLGSARDGEEPERLVQIADAAMYRAKRRGGARVELPAAAHDRASRPLEVENALRRGLANDELHVVYQPIVELAGEHRPVGAEALVRWRRPGVGVVGPARFIPVAETSGLIIEIGERVLRKALEQAVSWRCADERAPYVSVNLSARQLADADLPERVRVALETTGLDPARLCLEITESVAMAEPEPLLRRLGELASLGVRLAIDDFGTGFSSLTYLQRFPVDIVKIDRSFVDAVHGDQQSHAIVAAVVSMAQALGLTAIAEGVEREAQCERLRALGCAQAQGFLFARPVEADQIGGLLAGGAGRRSEAA